MRGFGLHQAQQATLGLHPNKYTGGSISKEGDTKNIFLDELHRTVMSGIENAKIKYKSHDVQSSVSSGNHKFRTKKMKKRHVTQRVQTKDNIKPESKIEIDCQHYIDYNDYDLFDIKKYTPKRVTLAPSAPVAVDKINTKSKMHLLVHNFQNTQKGIIELFQKTLDAADPYINKISHINKIINEFFAKEIIHIMFHEQYIEILCHLDIKSNLVAKLVDKNLKEIFFLFDKLQNQGDEMTKNDFRDDLITNSIEDIVNYGDDILNLLGEFTTLHNNCKTKYENEIKNYTYKLIRFANNKSFIDKTMTNYSEYLTAVAYEITTMNESKEKLYYKLDLLQNCMQIKDNLIVDHSRQEVINCQKTQDNNKQNSTLEDTYKKKICDIDNQQKIKNDLQVIIEQDCENLQQIVPTNMTEQAAESK
ncbi:hypothetical protein BDAP_000357 [Binucleata daphniae]